MFRCVLTAFTLLILGSRAIHGNQSKEFFNGRTLRTSFQNLERRSLLRKTDRVKGGIDAPVGRFPYVCNIRKIGSDVVVCGAALVSERWVLTAAHCVESGNSDAASISPIVHCGVNELEHENDDLVFITEEIRIHEDWDGKTENGNDIALLKLERPCNLTTPIMPRVNITFQIGRQFAVLGWGRTTSDGPYASTLQLADDLPYIPKKNCNSELLWDGIITDAMLCAGSGPTDSCQGDSGGPLILGNRKGDEDILEGTPNLDLLVGIVSFGKDPCGETGIPGVYTSVSYYIGWINKIINDEEEEENEEDPKERKEDVSTEATSDDKSIDTTEKGKHDSALEEKADDEEEETLRLLKGAKRKHRGNTKSENLKVAKKAITKDYSITLRAVLELGLNVNSIVESESKTTLLYWAAEHVAVDCVKVLIEAGAKITKKDTYDNTALAAATLAGSISLVKLLISEGADVKEKDKNGQTLLFSAGVTNTPSLVHYFLRKKVSLEAKDTFEQTAIFPASGFGSPSVVKAFLKYEPDLDVQDVHGIAPLHFAVSARNIIRDIFINGPVIPSLGSDGFTNPYIPSNTASGIVAKISSTFMLFPTRFQDRWEKAKPKNRDIDVVKLLLDAGASVSARDNQRKTPLHFAVACNSTEIVETLVEYGADVNATDKIWNTPLHEAAFWSTPDVVQALADADAYLEAKDLYGNTPLHIAMSYGNYNTSEALLENGADPFARNRRGLPVANTTCTLTTCTSTENIALQGLLLTYGLQAAFGTSG